MIDDSGKFEEGLKQLLKHLPAGLEEAGDEAKKTLRAGFAAALQRMDLVTREEYDIQVRLLERLRAQVDQLEQQIAAMQSGEVADRASSGGSDSKS